MINDILKWEAVISNDAIYDGRFFYAVKSTGVFCRPSCKSRPPLKENVEFFDTAEAAQEAGYRPCKRCRPDLIDFQPLMVIAEEAKAAIDTYYKERDALSEALNKIGITQRRLVDIFRQQYKVTPSEYADKLRIRAAKERLINSDDSLINIALFLGFDSVSAFYGFFRKHMHMTPGEYRQLHNFSNASLVSSYYIYETVLGNISISSDGNAIKSIQFENMINVYGNKAANYITDLAAKQLEEYFAGKRKHFDLPLHPIGTDFQKAVWHGLLSIPYGETRNYKQMAQMIGHPTASRAVGMANNKNPILIVIPCHRVVGSDGSPKGYSGGLEIKRRILELEAEFR